MAGSIWLEVGSDAAAAALYAIAAGATRYNEIQDAVGSDPVRALDRLTEARLVERLTPVDEDPIRSRRKIYRIADNFLAFYLGPVLRHRTEIERGYGARVIPALTRRIDDHMGERYEEAFREYLWHVAHTLDIPDVVAIGPWWRTGGQDQIDAVILAQPDLTRVPAAVGEAKWSRKVDGARIKAKLIAKAAGLTAEVDRLKYIVCARSEVVRGDDQTMVVTAADLYPDPGSTGDTGQSP